MTPNCLRGEAWRFQQITGNVQDLAMVKRLAAWEYLPMVSCYVVTRDQKLKFQNPWAVFQGVKEPVMGIGLGCQIEEKDMRYVLRKFLSCSCLSHVMSQHDIILRNIHIRALANSPVNIER